MEKFSLQNYFDIRSDPMAFMENTLAQQGEFAEFRVLQLPFLLLTDPELIREALVENSDQLVIQGGTSAGLARLIGHGILTNRGKDWQKSRSSLQPMFSQESLHRQVDVMRQMAQESLERWKELYSESSFSLNREILAMSFRMMAASLLSYVPTFMEAEDFADAVWILQLDGMNRYMAGSDYLPWLPTERNRKVNHAKELMRRLAVKMIEAGSPVALDEILSLLFAGTESPANSLCWSLKLLSEHPVILKNILSSTSLGQRDSHDLLSMVISETLRLYPAGWAFERFATADIKLGARKISKGTRVLISPYLLHRQARHWKNPEEFKPERFFSNSRGAEGVHRFAYIPFGAGPRSCLGSRYALMEMRMILQLIIQQFQWEFAREEGLPDVKALGSFKIRLSRPMHVYMRSVPSERQDSPSPP